MGISARILKHLAAMKVIDEIAENTYSSTTLAEALTDTKYRDGIIYLSVPL